MVSSIHCVERERISFTVIYCSITAVPRRLPTENWCNTRAKILLMFHCWDHRLLCSFRSSLISFTHESIFAGSRFTSSRSRSSSSSRFSRKCSVERIRSTLWTFKRLNNAERKHLGGNDSFIQRNWLVNLSHWPESGEFDILIYFLIFIAVNTNRVEKWFKCVSAFHLNLHHAFWWRFSCYKWSAILVRVMSVSIYAAQKKEEEKVL